MTRQFVALTGISGVGKSTLIKMLAASLPLEHLQASSLIKEGRFASSGAELTQDQLRLVDIDDNQKHLVRGFSLRVAVSTGLVILDGHTVIERYDGLTRIEARVFGAMGIDSMIFLFDDPESIAERRRHDTARERPVPSIDHLRFIQDESRVHAAAICRELDIPLRMFRPDQYALIAHTLRQQHVSRM